MLPYQEAISYHCNLASGAPLFWRDPAIGDHLVEPARPRPHTVAVIARMDQPSPADGAADDEADVVRPDHDDAGAGAVGIDALFRPFPRERQAPLGLAEQMHHVEAAPGQPISMRGLRPRERDRRH